MRRHKYGFVIVLVLFIFLANCRTSVMAVPELPNTVRPHPEMPLYNLAYRHPYTLQTTVMDSGMRHNEDTLFPDSHRRLTDGILGSVHWHHHGPWVGYLRQDQHDIVVDLGRIQTLHSLDAWFLQDRSAGVRFPHQVTFSISSDGFVWQNVGDVPTKLPLSEPGKHVQDFRVMDLNSAARYVKYTFFTDVWTFLSEVEVWGHPGIEPGAFMVTPSFERSVGPLGYPKAGVGPAKGRFHEALIYNGYYPNPNIGTWNYKSFLPYVAYLNKHHRCRDWMFDSFLFLPFDKAPSGGSYMTGTGTKEDWSQYVHQLFTPHAQLAALDEAVAVAESKLHRRRTVQVVIAIPFPGTSSRFAPGWDMNPDDVGQEQSLRNRLNAVKWYVAKVRDTFAAAKFHHLQLSGFYWLAENIHYGRTPNDERLVHDVGTIVHYAGPFTFDWIPFNQSEGFRNWKQDSFDDALMQPNYAWGAGSDRLQNTAFLANKYGLGVEMELDWLVLSKGQRGKEARENYEEYLDSAYEHQYEHSFLAWYQGYQVLRDAEQSPVKPIRNVYDETFAFLHDRFQPTGSLHLGDVGYLVLNTRHHRGEHRDVPNPDAEARLTTQPFGDELHR